MQNSFITLFASLGIILLFISIFIFIKNRKLRKKVLTFLAIGILLIAVSIPVYLYIDYSNSISNKNIKTDDITKLEETLQQKYNIKDLDVIVSRGGSVKFKVLLDENTNEQEYDNIKNDVEFSLKENLAQNNIEYCENNYDSSFAPQKNDFDICIKNDNNILFQSNLRT